MKKILNIGGGNNYSILTRGTIVDFQDDPDEPIQGDEWFKASSLGMDRRGILLSFRSCLDVQRST